MNRVTPFIKRLRVNGGTIYTFTSAVEDIGLNINERNNVVKISHFALLNIPSIDEPDDIKENKFNVRAIAGAWEYEQNNASLKDGKVLIAESFENYALNLESNLLNQPSYNAALSQTVSERVFWKWLKETGAIRWDIGPNIGGKQYWVEELDADGEAGYNSVIKYIGPVSAGNLRTDSFGTYNETYVLVPTSHGQTGIFFNAVEDDNYYHGMEIGNLGEKILGRENYTLPHPDALSFNAYYDFVDSSTAIGSYSTFFDNSTGSFSPGWWYTPEGIEPSSIDNSYIIDGSSYIDTGIYHTDLQYVQGMTTIAFRRSKVDCMSIVLDINQLKNIYGDSALTYDMMATKYAINDNYYFNAVLIYYSIYNSTMDEVLGTNLMGVLFMDAPTGNTSYIGNGGIVIPTLEKIQSGPAGFGTSYSFRLNIKTDSLLDDTQATIVDFATSDQIYAEDWASAFSNLEEAVNILSKNNSTLNFISDQYKQVQNAQTQLINDVEQITYQLNDTVEDIKGTNNTISMFADGEDPLVDSSIYMRFGNVGVHTNDPKYPLEINGTTKAKEIVIENAIRDTSNNILLGYGSPLQIGASTNERDIAFYTGNSEPALFIDSSSNSINIKKDVSVEGALYIGGASIQRGNVYIDGSVYYTGPVYFESSIFYEGDTKRYLALPDDLGSGLNWDGNLLSTVPSADVSAAGQTGWIQFNVTGGLFAQADLYWDYDINKKLTINGDVSINNNLLVGQDITSSGKIVSAGDISIGGDLNLAGNATLEGSIGISGNLNTQNLNTQNITASGDVSIGGELYPTLSSGIKSNAVYYDTLTGKLSYGAPSGGGGGGITGSGTANYISKFVGDTSVGNSILYENSSKIGIGTSSPDASLHVQGTVGIGASLAGSTGIMNLTVYNSAGSGSLGIYSSGANEPYIQIKNPLAIGSGAQIRGIGTVTGGLKIMDHTGSTNWAICTSSGLTLNNGSLYISDTNTKISEGVSNSIRLSTNNGYIDLGPRTSIYAEIYTDRNPSDGFYFNAVLRGADFILTSDARYKTNIFPIEESLDKVIRLNPIYFNWNEKAKEIDRYNTSREIGLLAQEAELVIPEIVNTSSDDVKSISYQKLAVMNTAAIKELNEKILYLESRLKELYEKLM